MPRWRTARGISLGGRQDSLTDAPRAKLELVKLSGDEGWHWGVLDGRKEIGRIAHARAVGGEWFWSLRWTGLSVYARTRAELAALARAWGANGAKR
jgi:hypothetical protein